METSDSLRDSGEERNTFEKDGFVAETSHGGKAHDFGEYGKGSNDKEVVANIVISKGPVNCNGFQVNNQQEILSCVMYFFLLPYFLPFLID